MADIQLNPLNSNQRRLLQLGAVLLLIAFLLIFFMVSRKSNIITLKNTTVYVQDSKLYLFDEVIPINQYPDRIVFHYPYLTVVKPTQQKSTIYNLETKKKEKEVQQILLDYSPNGTLFNLGESTHFNSQDLGVLCEKGFVKSTNEILCITKVDKNYSVNKLILIDIKTRKNKDLYVSQDLLTDVTVLNGITYLGEINLYTNKNYVLINNSRLEVPDVISLLYQMDGKVYFASYKSAFNGQKESFYLVDNEKVVKQKEEKIFLLK